MATTTNLNSLVINYLTQAQYDSAVSGGTIDANQLYLTPDAGNTLSSVGISNATNGGLTISGSPLTSDGTITIGHSNTLSSAQTTQAVYPIKIDINGHISAYGSAVTIPTVPSAGTTASAVSTSSSGGSATTWSKSDHVHSISSSTITSALGYTPYNSTNPNGYTTTPIMTWYGTSSTTASTAAKTATCSGFALQTGAIIGILFSTANTAATPTLNVNSTGAKTIYIGGNTALSATTNVLKWSANTMVYFMYDGTYYRYITSVSAGAVAPSRGANTWYGTSSTGATTQAKTSTIDNFVLTKGAVAYITFSTANTYTSAKITLNINSTGAYDVYYNNAVTSSTNTLPWNAGETLIFIFSGSYYYYAGKSVTKISQLTNDSGFITSSSLPSITLNGSSTTSPSFYAPTGAGTSGYYLKSNGSGAPSWTSFPTIPSITLNGSSSTSPSFYAPTSAGTSGYYLKSNGSGAPTWSSTLDATKLTGTVPTSCLPVYDGTVEEGFS